MWDEFEGSGDLASSVSAPAPDTTISIPQQQPSFDTAGAAAGTAKDILTSAKQLVTTVGSGVSSIIGVRKDVQANNAIQDNNRRIALQQSNTAAAIADYQNRTQIAQARSMFERAAGALTSNTGLVIGAALLGLALLWKVKA